MYTLSACLLPAFDSLVPSAGVFDLLPFVSTAFAYLHQFTCLLARLPRFFSLLLSYLYFSSLLIVIVHAQMQYMTFTHKHI